jgi:rhodanese-related sulfurtransferase
MRAILILLCLLLAPAWAQPTQIPTEQIECVREEKDAFFLDVRTAEEIRTLGTLPGSYNIPVEELEKRLDELPKDRLIMTA